MQQGANPVDIGTTLKHTTNAVVDTLTIIALRMESNYAIIGLVYLSPGHRVQSINSVMWIGDN